LSPITCRTIELEGPLDVTHAARLREQLRGELTSSSDDIALDLRGVHLIDSAGLGVLVWAQRLADGLGARLRIYDPQPRVARVLQITRVAAMLDLHVTAEAESRFELIAA